MMPKERESLHWKGFSHVRAANQLSVGISDMMKYSVLSVPWNSKLTNEDEELKASAFFRTPAIPKREYIYQARCF